MSRSTKMMAAALVLSFGAWQAWRAAAPGPSDMVPDASRPEWLRVVPPAVAIYSPGVLAGRGARRQSFPDAFGEAILPWQAGNYAEAATRLETLAGTYPDVAEAHFYQGAAWLLAGAPAESVEPLRRSVSRAPTPLYPEATWYLGVALLETGRLDEAADAFGDACSAGRPHACDAARYVRDGG